MNNCKKLILLAVLSVLMLLPSLASASSIAKVIAVSSEVMVEQNGKSKPLALKDDLFVKDVIRTDANGKVQLMFNDDSIVTVGTNSTFIMEDYSEADKVFKSNLAVGFARVVTGNIVVENPDGFSVRTPEATVGIRGTTLAISTLNGRTDVATENTLNNQSVVVGSLAIPPGQIAGFGLNGVVLSQPAPMSETQRDNLVIQGTIDQGVSSVGPSYIYPRELDDPNLLSNDASSMQSSLNNLNTLNEGMASSNATVSGSLTGTGLTGSFSFNANLLNGAITGGNLTYDDTSGVNAQNFIGTGGVGRIDSDDFELAGQGSLFESGALMESGTWNMEGDTGIVPGQSVSGEWESDLPGGGVEGDFTGTVAQ